LDFDSQEVLAKHVAYSFDRPGPSTLVEHAMVLLTYQPHGCGTEYASDTESSLRRVLAPVIAR
jgi:hypothetical protein